MLFGSQGGDKQHRVAITSNLEFNLNWDNIDIDGALLSNR